MTRADKGIVFFLVAYYCAAMLTGTYYYQHRATPPMMAGDTMIAGMFWPFYWSWRAAMKVTE